MLWKVCGCYHHINCVITSCLWFIIQCLVMISDLCLWVLVLFTWPCIILWMCTEDNVFYWCFYWNYFIQITLIKVKTKHCYCMSYLLFSAYCFNAQSKNNAIMVYFLPKLPLLYKLCIPFKSQPYMWNIETETQWEQLWCSSLNSWNDPQVKCWKGAQGRVHREPSFWTWSLMKAEVSSFVSMGRSLFDGTCLRGLISGCLCLPPLN